MRLAARQGGTIMMFVLLKSSHFGVLPNDTQSVPSPVPASKLRVSVHQNGANFIPPNVMARTYYVPNGLMYVGDKSTFYGAIIAKDIELEDAMTTSDTSGGLGGAGTYSNFTTYGPGKISRRADLCGGG